MKTSTDPDPSALLRLRIMNPTRCSGSSECLVNATLSDSVYELKERVVEALDCKGKYVRLIAAGRLLAPDEQRLEKFSQLRDNAVIHAVVSAASPSPLTRSMAFSGTGSRFRNDMSDDNDDDGGGNVGGESNTGGFDRLREYGLSRSEINSLRTFFSPQVNAFAEARGLLNEREGSQADISQSSQDGDEGGQSERQENDVIGDSSPGDPEVGSSSPNENETARHRQERLEDAWIAAQGEAGAEFGANFLGGRRRFGSASLFANEDVFMESNALLGDGQNDNAGVPRARQMRFFPFRGGESTEDRFSPTDSELGQPRDFVIGFLMGFLLGVIMLFWLWEQGTYRQKMGIMSGIFCQLALRYMQRAIDAGSEQEASVSLGGDTAEVEDLQDEKSIPPS